MYIQIPLLTYNENNILYKLLLVISKSIHNNSLIAVENSRWVIQSNSGIPAEKISSNKKLTKYIGILAKFV